MVLSPNNQDSQKSLKNKTSVSLTNNIGKKSKKKVKSTIENNNSNKINTFMFS